MVLWVSEEKPASADALAELEARLGRELPREYRRWLGERDGGSPRPAAFIVPGHPEAVFEVQVFFGVQRPVESSRLSWNVENYPALVDGGWLPIGCTDTNDLVLLGISDENNGEAAFLDSAQSPTQLWPIAPTFEALIESLHDPGD